MEPSAISTSCVSSVSRSGLATSASGVRRRAPGAIGEAVEVAGATIRQGDVVLDADGAVVVERERVEDVLAAARDREERERVKREKLQAGASCRTTSTTSDAWSSSERADPRPGANRARGAFDAEAGGEPASSSTCSA